MNKTVGSIGALPLLMVLFMASCAFPPKNPEVDGTSRRPVNDPEMMEALRTGMPTGSSMPDEPEDQVMRDLSVMRVMSARRHHFLFADTRLRLAPDERNGWLADAEAADWIQVLGRTDNRRKTAFDLEIARGRAYAAHGFLVDNGIPADRITVNYSSAADYMADNETAEGRSMNRRVEIIFYTRKEAP